MTGAIGEQKVTELVHVADWFGTVGSDAIDKITAGKTWLETFSGELNRVTQSRVFDTIRLKGIERFRPRWPSTDEDISPRILTEIERRASGVDSFEFFVITSDIQAGSIKFKDGKIVITSRALILMVTAYTTFWGGVMHYKEAREGLFAISSDISRVVDYMRNKDGDDVSIMCEPVDATRLFNEYNAILQKPGSS